jgi:hypothetical protein
LDIRLGLDGLGGDIGVAAEGLGSWEIEKLRKSMCRGPPEPDDAEAEPASVAREARRGSGPREGGLPDLTLDPPALRRFGARGESGDRSRIARVDSRRRAIFFSDGGGGRGRSSSGGVSEELEWAAKGCGLNVSTNGMSEGTANTCRRCEADVRCFLAYRQMIDTRGGSQVSE